MKKLLLSFFMFSVTTGGTLAQESVPVDAPANANITPVIVTQLLTAVRNRVDWWTCVSFRNNTAQRIAAIQFEFTYLDAFDTPINSFRADRVGNFAPGVLVEGPENTAIIGGGNISQKLPNCWEVPQIVGSLSKVTVQVAKVRYGDGTIWVAPSDRPVFTATYMNDSGVDHPDSLKCQVGILAVVISWDRLMTAANDPNNSHRDMPRRCLERWYHDNKEASPWDLPLPSPLPSAPLPGVTPHR